jgi:FtsZ-binding cell division protein ZapB
LDNELIIKQFDEIESKVERIISTLQTFKTENAELKQQINSLEEALRQREEAETHFAEEKRQIRAKIDGLLSKLDDLAKSDS